MCLCLYLSPKLVFRNGKMPQEAWVLKCYSCKKFQVQLQKKAKKWQCKVCGAKQDLMTIFYKGQPGDCRINVQNMNAAEGEMKEKLFQQQESSFQNLDYCEYQNVPLNSHQYCSFSYSDMEEFNDEVIAELDEKCTEVEETYSQQMTGSQNYEENFEYDTQEKIPTNEQQYYEISNVVDKTKKDFGTDFDNCETDTCKNEISKNQKQEVKSSIFESNCDFDEFLDF